MGRGYRSCFSRGEWAIDGLAVLAIIAAATTVGYLL
jgi:hypothetical protein